MTYNNDWKKLLITEIKAGRQLQDAAWSNCPSPDTETWYCNFAFGEVVDIQVDGVSLTRKTSLIDCQAAAGSYYHDFFASILYVQLTDGGDPGEYISPDYTYNVIVYFWKCIANRQEVGAEAVVYIPEGCTYPVFYDPTLKEDSVGQLTATIADRFESEMETNFGSISVTNADGWWYAGVDDFYWNNADIRVRAGSIGDIYADLEKIFIGKVKDVAVSDDAANFILVDSREGRLQSIPIEHYNLIDYPLMLADSEGVPIPVLFGKKMNILPIMIDTVAFKYKISQTRFGTQVFEISAVDAVYKNGILLVLGTDYSVDLHNGNIILVANPGDEGITCDAKGICNNFDMTTGYPTGLYSENIADHLFFVLNVMNEIPIADIDLPSFAAFQVARTQAVAWYLDTDTPTIDFNRLLQQTVLYHFLPLNNGIFAVRYYKRTVPAGSLELRNYDHSGYKKTKSSEGVFYDIILKYDKDPSLGLWKSLQNFESGTLEKHKTKEPYTIETALRDVTEAQLILDFYVALLKDPPTKMETAISIIGSAILPSDKIYSSRSIVADGKSVTISTDEIYLIMQTRRNFADGKVGITARLDLDLAILLHADQAHQDVAHEDHSDSSHDDGPYNDHDDDVPHNDTPHVDHTDETHQDIPEYIDAAYDDHTDHDDVLYSDAYTDDAYVDTPHADHTDVAHADTAHGDTPYSDEPHEDEAHANHTDESHANAHSDIEHIDSVI